MTGDDEVSFPRYDLVGIAPGSPRELDYWSGRFNINLRADNTEQADPVTKNDDFRLNLPLGVKF